MLIRADARHLPLADESVQCCITSPPYWGLRRYDVDGPAIGLEDTPEAWLDEMVTVFREVRRVLRKDGTAWVNVGDGYNAQQGKGYPGFSNRNFAADQGVKRKQPPGLKPKDLIGLPWRLALALQADGWWLRSDIIWSKPNPMPESVTDRPTRAHEYIFLLTKAKTYYYDADAVRERGAGRLDRSPGSKGRIGKQGWQANTLTNPAGRNARSVWTIPTQAYPEAHFATFPEEIPRRCIKAGTSARGACPACGAPWERVTLDAGYSKHRPSAGDDPRSRSEDKQALGSLGGHHGWKGNNLLKNPPITTGWRPTCKCPEAEPVPCVVLDPFGGSGTTARVALELGRRAVSIDLGYHELAKKRLTNIQPDMLAVTAE